MNIFALCGIALIAFSAIEILGREKQSLGFAVGAVGTVCLIAPAIFALSDVFSSFGALLEKFRFAGGDLLFRSFGIGLCCEVTGGILRDAGRQNLANALDLSCKAAILLLCVPLWRQLFAFIGELTQ